MKLMCVGAVARERAVLRVDEMSGVSSLVGDVDALGPVHDQLVTQFEDVLVDDRGYIFCTDENRGLFVLRFDKPLETAQ